MRAAPPDAVDAGGDRKQMPPCDNGVICHPLGTATAAATAVAAAATGRWRFGHEIN